jgi:hypothetical protein
VTTALGPELDELDELEPEPLVGLMVDVGETLEPDDAVDPEETVDPEDAVDPADAWWASAGSWPVTSITAISSHVATNSATAAVTTRRRIIRTRTYRAFRIAMAWACVMDGIMSAVRSSPVRTR